MSEYFGHETRPQHFLYPMVMAIIGGIFAHIRTWEWVGYLIYGIALVTTVWLFYASYKKHQIEEIREHYYHDVEMMKLDGSRTKTKVAIEKTDLTGFLHTNFSDLAIAPAKLKRFALGVLRDGKKMTIREWTPLKTGRLFSDPEWRRLTSFMKQPDWEDKHIKFIVPITPGNENDGFEPTAAGRKWLEGVLEETTVLIAA